MFDIALRNVKDALLEPILASIQGTLVRNHVSPNTLTLIGGGFGVLTAINAALDGIEKDSSIYRYYAVACLALNRLLDGIDGTYARRTGQATDYGGYLDIIIDFSIYGLLPLALVVGRQDHALCLAMGLLEVTFFVNAAGVFMLSAILEKRSQKGKKEVTSVTMPSGLVEGFESMAFFFAMVLLPEHALYIFLCFAAGVGVTICQRLHWASCHL